MPRTHRSLTIVEIVTQIIAEIDWKTTVACACVCKQWSEIALDKIWQTIESEFGTNEFFHLLAILSHDELGGYGYSGAEKPDSLVRQIDRSPLPDWRRFACYAARVKTFTYNPGADGYWTSSPVTEVARIVQTCPMLHLLPHLRKLWFYVRPDNDGSILYVSKLACESLQEITLEFPLLKEMTARKERIQRLMVEIAIRAPNITSVTIALDGIPSCSEIADMEPGILLLLKGLVHLQQFRFSSYLSTSVILNAAARLPRLKRMAAYSSEVEIYLGRSHLPRLEDHPGRFPCLETLSLDHPLASVPSLISFFDARESFQQLHTLNLYTRDVTSFYELLSAVCTCKSLEEIHINEIQTGMSSVPCAFEGNALSPLRHLPNLSTFTLRHEASNSMTDFDLADVFRCCPGLTKLHILPRHPYQHRTLHFTFCVLSLLSQIPNRVVSLLYQPSLEQLESVPAEGLFGKVGNNLKSLKQLGFELDILNEAYEAMFNEGSDEVESTLRKAVREYFGRCLSEDCAKGALRSFDRFHHEYVEG